MVNKTELMALEWLEKKGYKKKEIIKNKNYSPDFVCMDGKRYEVKFLYGKRLLFYEDQMKYFKPKDTILVFDRNGFVMRFLWKDRKKMPLDIKIVNINNLKHIGVSEEVKSKLDKMKKHPRETYDDILKRILKNKIVRRSK